MNAWLVLQEGPGAGRSYPLDPFQQAVLSVGRSAQCDVVLNDHRASRHHADIRWNGRQWIVVDLGSTNGTYVNGLQVSGPYDLRAGDRVTIGETTMVLREPGSTPSAPATPAQPAPQSPAPRGGGPSAERQRTAGMTALQRPASAPAPQRVPPPPPAGGALPVARGKAGTTHSRGLSVAFWGVQALVIIAVVLLASGAVLPWVRVTVSPSPEILALAEDLRQLTQALGSLPEQLNFLPEQLGFLPEGIRLLPDKLGTFPQAAIDLANSILEPGSLLPTQEISGLDGYGKLTLGIAVLCLIVLIVDLFFYRKSAVPGAVYLLAGLIAIGFMVSSLATLLQVYQKAQNVPLVFGIRLGQIIKGFDYVIDVDVTALPGLWFTLLGLVLLILGGAGRLAVALLSRTREEMPA